MSNFLTAMIQWLVSVLPADPIRPFIDSLNLPYLGFLNWFVPIGTFINILSAWGAAITLWYVWSSLARFLHMVD